MSEAKNRDTSDAKDAKDFARWIVRNDVETGDHACAQCWPGGEIVIAGFVCVYHRAVAVSRGTNSDPPMTSARFATHFFEAMASARNEEASTQRAPELRTTSAPPEGWTVAAWREDGCPCARCNVSMAWEGDDPDDASEALCGGCKHIELQALRERVKGTSDATARRDAVPAMSDVRVEQLASGKINPAGTVSLDEARQMAVEIQSHRSARRTDYPTAWPDMPAWAGDDVNDERPLPEDAEIQAAFPTRSGRHDLYGEAMRLVGARRSKGGLVALVTWLLLRAETTQKRSVATEEKP